MTSTRSRTRLPQGFVGCAVLTGLSVFASSAITVALPEVASDFDAGEATTGWVLAAFMLTFRVGMTLFVAGSLLGAVVAGSIAQTASLRMAALGLVVFPLAAAVLGVGAVDREEPMAAA